VLLVERDGVERVAAGLDADASQGLRAAVVLEGERVREDLRDRLQRERIRAVPVVPLRSVDVRERDAEQVRLGPHLGWVEADDLVVAEGAVAGVQLRHLLLDDRGVLDVGHQVRAICSRSQPALRAPARYALS
jgi:hypothetical protein